MMKQDFRQYEQTIKKVYSFRKTPTYEESFQTELNTDAALAVAIKTFEELAWMLIYRDEKTVVAYRMGAWGKGNETEKISITCEHGVVSVKSVSAKNEFWDGGANSKRVKLFVYAFQTIAKGVDPETLKKMGDDYKREINWDDYVIPEKLPAPKNRRTPHFLIALIAGIFAAFFIGAAIAYLIVEGYYVQLLSEVCIGVLIILLFNCLIRLSNYSQPGPFTFLLFAVVVISYLSGEYFEYKMAVEKYDMQIFRFMEYMELKTTMRLPVGYLNTNLITWVMLKVVQIVSTGYFCYLFLHINLITYVRKRVPPEVVDFAYYHFLTGKNPDEVRTELAKKGWQSCQCQDEVFEALGLMQSISGLNKM